jgi:hypothetical protein
MLMTAFAALLSLMVACGGGGAGGDDGITAGDISDEQLSQMLLSQSEWGDEYAALEPSGSLLEDREQRAQRVSEDEAQDLERFGELKSYQDGYGREEAFEEGTGPLRVGTTVYLFESGKGASDYLEDDIEDLQEAIGEERARITIHSVDRFAVEGIGDEAVGLQIISTYLTEYGLVAVYQTMVSFREGGVLAFVSIMRLDNTNLNAEVTALARKLDQRIWAVLGGGVEPTPAETQ